MVSLSERNLVGRAFCDRGVLWISYKDKIKRPIKNFANDLPPEDQSFEEIKRKIDFVCKDEYLREFGYEGGLPKILITREYDDFLERYEYFVETIREVFSLGELYGR